MTLAHSERKVVRAAINADVVPDEIVRTVEGDEELAHLSEAAESLRYADACGDKREYRRLQSETFDAAVRRARELIDAAGYREELPA